MNLRYFVEIQEKIDIISGIVNVEEEKVSIHAESVNEVGVYNAENYEAKIASSYIKIHISTFRGRSHESLNFSVRHDSIYIFLAGFYLLAEQYANNENVKRMTFVGFLKKINPFEA